MGRPASTRFAELIYEMSALSLRADLDVGGKHCAADALLLDALWALHQGVAPTDAQIARFDEAYKNITDPADVEPSPLQAPRFHVDATQPRDYALHLHTPTPADLEARFGLDSYLPIHFEMEVSEDTAAFRTRVTLEHEHHWRDMGMQVVTDPTPHRYNWQSCVHCRAKRGFKELCEARHG